MDRALLADMADYKPAKSFIVKSFCRGNCRSGIRALVYPGIEPFFKIMQRTLLSPAEGHSIHWLMNGI